MEKLYVFLFFLLFVTAANGYKHVINPDTMDDVFLESQKEHLSIVNTKAIIDLKEGRTNYTASFLLDPTAPVKFSFNAFTRENLVSAEMNLTLHSEPEMLLICFKIFNSPDGMYVRGCNATIPIHITADDSFSFTFGHDGTLTFNGHIIATLSNKIFESELEGNGKRQLDFELSAEVKPLDGKLVDVKFRIPLEIFAVDAPPTTTTTTTTTTMVSTTLPAKSKASSSTVASNEAGADGSPDTLNSGSVLWQWIAPLSFFFFSFSTVIFFCICCFIRRKNSSKQNSGTASPTTLPLNSGENVKNSAPPHASQTLDSVETQQAANVTNDETLLSDIKTAKNVQAAPMAITPRLIAPQTPVKQHQPAVAPKEVLYEEISKIPTKPPPTGVKEAEYIEFKFAQKGGNM
jgi:hypothetical protein